MIQKMILNVECTKPLKDYGNGHILIYDDSTKNYHITTREEFLKEQNKKIEDLYKFFEQYKNELSRKVDKVSIEQHNFIQINNKNYDDFVKESNEKYNEFLSTYKITNEKMINLIKSVVTKEEN